MNKLIFPGLFGLMLVAGGCANCKPCKFNADQEKTNRETQKALDAIKAPPTAPNPPK